MGRATHEDAVSHQFEEFTGWRKWLFNVLPRPKGPLHQYSQPVKRVLVITRLPNPTFDYYLAERLEALEGIPFHVHSITDKTAPTVEAKSTYVIVCRYIDGASLSWLEKNSAQLAGVSLFLDDDIPAVVSAPNVKLTFKLYVWKLGLYPLKRLNKLLSEVLVSTQELASIYQRFGATVRVLPPMPKAEFKPPANPNDKTVKIAFHATGVHHIEHEFLKPIIEDVLAEFENVQFELFANNDMAKYWRKANIKPQQLLIEPILKWPDYLNHVEQNPADIALVPMMRQFINAGRSDTKRIDVARMGAAPIFSKNSIYSRCAKPEEFHIENNPALWAKSIRALITDVEKRRSAAVAAQASLQTMRSRAFESGSIIKY